MTALGAAHDRLSGILLLGGAAVSMLPLSALALYAFPSADDYCVAVQTHNGFWQMQVDSYLLWTGRYTAMFLLAVLSRWDLATLYPWVSTITLMATLLSFQALIGAVAPSDAPRLLPAMVGAIACAVFAGSLPSLTEAFFWMTSAVTYQWALITYLTWLALLIRMMRHGDRGGSQMMCRTTVAALTIILPGFNEILIPIILITLAVSAAVSWQQRLSVHHFMLMLLTLAVGFSVISLLAPGNPLRSSTYPDIPTRHSLTFALTETARQSGRFLAKFGWYPALWIATCAAWWWVPQLVPHVITRLQGMRRIAVLLVPVAVVYVTLFPLYWEYGTDNYTGEGRTYNITFFFFCATFVPTVGSLLATLVQPSLTLRLRARGVIVDRVLAGTLALLMVGSPATVQAFQAWRQAPRYLKAQQGRESILRAPENRGKSILVNGMYRRPRGLFTGDLQPDESHWINVCVARYYGLRSVRTR